MLEVEFGDFDADHTETPMSRTIMDLSELLQKHDQGDLPRGIEPPRVYRRVKHSKDEPHDTETIHPRLSR